MNQLNLQWAIILQWNENGNLRTQQISKQQVNGNSHNGAIIIGRDPKICDIVLKDRSVSAQHVEIYFHEQQQKFFIKNLSPQNVSNIDGQNLDFGRELPLQNNSSIVLGMQSLKVTDIQIYELESTVYSGIVHSNTNSVQVSHSQNLSQVIPTPSLGQVIPSQNSGQAISASPIMNPNQANSSTNQNSKKERTWQDKTIVAAIVAAIATILAAGISALTTYYTNETTRKTEEKKAKLQRDADLTKTNIETLAKKQEKAEDRFYAHKAEISKLEKNNVGDFRRVELRNNCDKDINIAINFTALNETEQTKGWFTIPRNDSTNHSILTKYRTIFLYAETNDNKYQWQEGAYREKYTVKGHFDYIADDITLFYPDQNKRELNKFHQVKFDDSGTTKKTFTCDRDSLKLN
ncbi:MAG: FHA domain-containing protein [Nostocales cyanobacterium 94392]|nr:FHA domain-containing protein [Nostocales cyanobacterium 94392]